VVATVSRREAFFVNMSEPDFIWSPYQGFTTPLIEDTWAIGGSYIHTFSASLTNDSA